MSGVLVEAEDSQCGLPDPFSELRGHCPNATQ